MEFNDSRTFGVEIEFNTPNYADTLHQVSLVVPVIERNASRNGFSETDWVFKDDASLGPMGKELVSPPLRGKEAFDTIQEVCNTLVGTGGNIDSRCGLHVHHGVRDMNAKQAVNAVHAYDWMYGLIEPVLAESRKDSRWALKVRPNERQLYKRMRGEQNQNTEWIRKYLSNGRYRTVNLSPGGQGFLRGRWDGIVKSTIEFRQHQGTLNPKKIEMWVRMTQLIIEMSKREVLDFTDQPAINDAYYFKWVVTKVLAMGSKNFGDIIKYVEDRQAQLEQGRVLRELNSQEDAHSVPMPPTRRRRGSSINAQADRMYRVVNTRWTG